jgi:phytoene dehydrogenase-like protein
MRVLVVERSAKFGGALRTEELTVPGFKHDQCGSIRANANVSTVQVGVRRRRIAVYHKHECVCQRISDVKFRRGVRRPGPKWEMS